MSKTTFFKPKKTKKQTNLITSPLPLYDQRICLKNKFTGKFTGLGVEVVESESMQLLHSQGYFGKGNLSRSQPARNNDITSEETPETLHLSLEEAFFLSYALGCLQVYHNESLFLDLDEMWELFRQSSSNFVTHYVAYHHFRSEGWTVRSGIKFGSDFLLYKRGPDFYHASYSVLVIPTNDQTVQKKYSWIDFSGIDRITESAAKELMFCYVCFPSNFNCQNGIDNLKLIKVHEVVFKRWVAAQQRDN